MSDKFRQLLKEEVTLTDVRVFLDTQDKQDFKVLFFALNTMPDNTVAAYFWEHAPENVFTPQISYLSSLFARDRYWDVNFTVSDEPYSYISIPWSELEENTFSFNFDTSSYISLQARLDILNRAWGFQQALSRLYTKQMMDKSPFWLDCFVEILNEKRAAFLKKRP